jgi:hypothetical protein
MPPIELKQKKQQKNINKKNDYMPFQSQRKNDIDILRKRKIMDHNFTCNVQFIPLPVFEIFINEVIAELEKLKNG